MQNSCWHILLQTFNEIKLGSSIQNHTIKLLISFWRLRRNEPSQWKKLERALVQIVNRFNSLLQESQKESVARNTLLHTTDIFEYSINLIIPKRSALEFFFKSLMSQRKFIWFGI